MVDDCWSDLLRSARDGDCRAGAIIADFLRARVLPLVRSQLSPRTETVELLNETYLAILRGRIGLRRDDSFLAYALRVAWHRAIALERASRSSRPIEEGDDVPIHHGDTRQIEQEEILEALQRVFTPRQSGLFHGLFVEGKTNAEMRRELGVSDGTLRNLKSQLLKTARKALRELAEEE